MNLASNWYYKGTEDREKIIGRKRISKMHGKGIIC
jgi:hypothetical protein